MSACGTSALGPFRVRPWRGLRVMDSEHEAQDELVEIGGRQYRVHPAAVFPIMSSRELDELVEDVRVNGLREPVVVRGDQSDGRAEPGPSVCGCRCRPEVREPPPPPSPAALKQTHPSRQAGRPTVEEARICR